MNDTITRGITIFERNVATLSEASYDEEHKMSMVNSEIKVINFDDVKKELYRNLSKKLKSVDALHISGQPREKNNTKMLIEFKNGSLGERNCKEVDLKVRDSVVIYKRISGDGDVDIGDSMFFVLVYNEAKNPRENEEKRPQAQLASAIAGKAKTNHYRFGMDKHVGNPFKRVYTLTPREFIEEFEIPVRENF